MNHSLRMTGPLDPRDGWTAEGCTIAKALDVIPTRSAFLVLREAFYGTTRFDDFAHQIVAQHIVAEDICDWVKSSTDSVSHDTMYASLAERFTDRNGFRSGFWFDYSCRELPCDPAVWLSSLDDFTPTSLASKAGASSGEVSRATWAIRLAGAQSACRLLLPRC